MATEAAMLAALNKAAAIPSEAPLAQADMSSLCAKYKSMRESLVFALPLIKKTPTIGANLAAVLEFLMQLSDASCPQARKRARTSLRPPDTRAIPFES
jgi:hypothetical protein